MLNCFVDVDEIDVTGVDGIVDIDGDAADGVEGMVWGRAEDRRTVRGDG